MLLEECAHCITPVLFKPNGTCPACGKSKYVSPGKSRDKIILENEKKEMEIQIRYYKQRGRYLMLGGGLATVGAIVLVIVTLVAGVFVIWWWGGILLGAGLMSKGYSMVNNSQQLQFQYDKKFKLIR